jgi:hypothetical protein
MDRDVKISATDKGIVSSDKRLELALEHVRSSREEAEKFAADPQAYLRSQGVETGGLKFSAPELSDADLQQVAGGSAEDFSTVCGSVGCVGCVSVGN